MNDDQLQHARRIAHLISGFLRNNLTPEERIELDEWIDANDANMQLFEKLTEEKNIATSMQWIQELENKTIAPKKPVPIFSIQRVAAVAAIVFIVSAGWWMWNSIIRKDQSKTAALIVNDTSSIVPGSKKAILITPSCTIDLAAVQSHQINFDDNNRAGLEPDGLHYNATNISSALHTLKTPTGGEYQLVLPDGTRAWLNAASSITYPVAFTGDKRNVSITGEVYFEVAHNSTQPFVVSTGPQSDITVTGTRFNARHYSAIGKVTLLEGGVIIRKGAQSSRLSPGQQAVMQHDEIAITTSPDAAKAIAWTIGQFSFTAASLTDIMEDVSRWYGVSFKFDQPIDKIVTGSILRSSSLDEVLQMLTLACGVHFTVQNKTIHIQP